MTQQKKGMPPVSGITRSTQNATESRSLKVVHKYTKHGIEIPINSEIVLINGMEGVSIISCRMKCFSTGAFGAFATFFMNTLL
jgi:methionine aminopeptidase